MILGGGRSYFIPNTTTGPESEQGRRADGQNLIEEWTTKHGKGAFVWNKTALVNQDLSKIDNLLGIMKRFNLLVLIGLIYEITTEHNLELLMYLIEPSLH